MSPCLNTNDRPFVLCCSLPGTDVIAQMLPYLNIMFCGKKTRMRLIHTYRELYPHNCFYFSILFTTSFVFPSFPVTTSARTHTHNTPHTQLITTHRTSHLLFHTQLAPHQSFTISFLFPSFPMPSFTFLLLLVEEVGMWGYPSFICVSVLSSLVSIDAEDSALRRQTKEVATHLTESCSKA